MKPLVTFVVPIYNSEKYLAECLDSICAQTYGNWEAVLVNDGSKDHSGEICKKYAESENRFRIIVQNNSGQAKARNTGLKAARGKYVAFIDSDDWIEREYLAFLVSKAELENLDMVMCHTMAEYPNGRSIELERMDIKEVVARKTELDFFKLYSYNSGYSKEKYGFINTPWGKLFKIEVLKKNNLYFNDEAKMIEDQLFFSEFLEYADSIGIYKKNLYHYRMLDASAAHRFRENYLEHCMAYLKCNEKLLDKYHKNDGIFKERYYNMVCGILMLTLRNYFFHPAYSGNRSESIKELKRLLHTEPYQSALLKRDGRTLKNNETRVVLNLLQMHFYGLLFVYFKGRPFLKKIFVFFKGYQPIKTDKELCGNKRCCGCGLCAMVCPENCISMEFDKDGYRHPQIDIDRCIKCNRCLSMCVVSNPEHKVKPIKVYGAWHIEDDVRRKSSSGGMFTAIAEAAFSRNLPVYAVEETETGLAFKKALCIKDIEKMHGSKYYQAFFDNAILEDMRKEKKGGVIFGLPCHIAQVKKYLHDNPDFYFVDLVCHGVCSKYLVDLYRKEIEKYYGKKLTRHRFRCKREGEKGSQVSCYEFADEKKYFDNEDDLYMHFFSSNFSLMEACYYCRYAGEERVGDITIGDFNGASKVLTILPEDGCASALLVNTYKGEKLIKNCNIMKYEVPIEVIKEQNIPLAHYTKRPWFRGMVYPTIRLLGFRRGRYIFGAKYYLKKVIIHIGGEDILNRIKRILGRTIITQ